MNFKIGIRNKIVSIPKGTIESFFARFRCRLSEMFQFQKVRLRAHQRLPLPRLWGCFNSKRYDWEATVAAYQEEYDAVSIPKGTIESGNDSQKRGNLKKFQFQKVRLRGAFSRFCFSICLHFNSKRYDWERIILSWSGSGRRFQFQKVRLRGKGRIDGWYAHFDFNSKRYDWEKSGEAQPIGVIEISIPKGTIESYRVFELEEHDNNFNSKRYDWELQSIDLFEKKGRNFNSKRYDWELRLAAWTATEILISIPKGTIESPRPRTEKRKRGRFQFQKVRLRVATLAEVNVRIGDFNSKRYDWESEYPESNWINFAISIPKGTIESSELRIVRTAAAKFQFQKVRLRVTRCSKTCKNNSNFNSKRYDWEKLLTATTNRYGTISIPKGTIESRKISHCFTDFLLFQFQKVRLRER